MARTEDQLAALLALPEKDRARLASALLDSLDDEAEPGTSATWERAWIDEINHRLTELESGRTRSVPADAVFAELRDRIDSQAD